MIECFLQWILYLWALWLKNCFNTFELSLVLSLWSIVMIFPLCLSFECGSFASIYLFYLFCNFISLFEIKHLKEKHIFFSIKKNRIAFGIVWEKLELNHLKLKFVFFEKISIYRHFGNITCILKWRNLSLSLSRTYDSSNLNLHLISFCTLLSQGFTSWVSFP